MLRPCLALVALVSVAASAEATPFVFDSDPFAGSAALTTPGRQIVGGEAFITFDVATDVFVFDAAVFGISSLSLVNGDTSVIPAAGANVVVLQEFLPPVNAGTAANLIAAAISTSGPGFFVYFNTGLDLPRLVFSTDLDDSTADLKVLARLENLTGQTGRDAFPQFTAANFQLSTTPVPEPASVLLVGLGISSMVGWRVARRRRQRDGED